MAGERCKIPGWAPACVWAGVIMAGTSVPTLRALPLGEEGSDKLVHFCAYLVLGYLVYRALGATRTRGRSKAALCVALCAAWALVDEAHQALIPLRSPEITDLIADVAGSGAGIALRWFRYRTEERLVKGDQEANDR